MNNLNRILILLLFFCNQSYSQLVISSCTSDESTNSTYLPSAQRLTMRKFIQENSTYLDSIHIPQSHVDTVLNALIAVYNASGLAARDTVVDIYGITATNYPTVNGIYVQVDTSASWADSLDNGVIPTGNFYIDSLISTHYLNLTSYHETGFSNYGIASFISDSNYNIFALADAFLAAPSVLGSGLSAFVMDGNDISCTIHTDYVELTYSIGWGDCMSGCINHRFWVFKVYYDCSVEYVGSYGDVIYYMDNNNHKNENISVYPNPANDLIYISDYQTQTLEFQLFSMTGQLIRFGSVENNKINIADIPPGNYFLRLSGSKATYVTGIIKN